MSRSGNRRPSGARPVEVVEVSERNLTLRVVLLILVAAIALTAFGYAIYTYFNDRRTPTAGWHTVTVSSDSQSLAHEFVFSYDWDASDAASEYNRLKELYADAMKKMYTLFESDAEPNGNISEINASVNKEITVDPVLYRALSQAAESGSRYIYMAPLYTDYENTFFGNGDAPIVEDYDPYVDPITAEYYAEVAAFANDSASVELRLLGDNKVLLYVSEEYLLFAEENGISRFVDFFRIQNAFIVDYIAELMTESGFTCGSVSSYDGYVRSFDTRDVSYSYNLFDRIGNEVAQIARFSYTGSAAIVYLRNYPLGELDSYCFYVSANKTIPPYIDGADGKYRTALDGIISVSKEKSCFETVMALLPLYISDIPDHAAIAELSDDAIYSAWNGVDGVIYYSDASMKPDEIFSYEDAVYTAELYGG